MIVLPTLLTLVVVIAVLGALHWILIGRQPELGNERKFPRQIILLLLTIVGVLAVVLALPISEGSRNQLIGLIGILISAIVAFSSTGVVANLMAGILLRITKPFRTGDYIRVTDHYGRVVERGLFDTEVQTETSELIALPNTLLITNPVIAVRSSGTIISTTVSLGYDVHHSQVRSALLTAAENCGLEDPFVHVLELGNYSVVYRISGLLSDVKKMITARSDLNLSVLDALHDQDIEIMSPAIMNQRPMAGDHKVLPVQSCIQAVPEETVSAEDIAFDKAEQAEKRSGEREDLVCKIENLQAALKDAAEEDRARLNETLSGYHLRLKQIEEESPGTEA